MSTRLSQLKISTKNWQSRLILVFIVLNTLVYLASAARSAAHNRLDVDEVFALWVERLPDPAQIYHALWMGGEYNPPLFPNLLHIWAGILGQNDFVTRVPSILAGFAAALFGFLLFKRYTSKPAALLGFSLILSGQLFFFATIVRPYALTVACYTLAVLLWDNINQRKYIVPSLVGIGISLNISISLNVYSVLYIPDLCLLEIIYSVAYKCFRRGVWLAFLSSVISMAIWGPLAKHVSTYNVAEKKSLNFYAHPTLHRLSWSLNDILWPANFRRFGFLSVLVGLASAAFAIRQIQGNPLNALAKAKQSSPLVYVAGCALVLPLITFTFACFVSGAYSMRYVLPATIGIAAVSSILIDFVKPATLWILGPLLSVIVTISHLSDPFLTPSQLPSIFTHVPQTDPIVVTESSIFFEEMENHALTAEQKARIYYLTLPAQFVINDLTGEDSIIHWKRINPDLHINDVNNFIASRACVYLFVTPSSSPDLLNYLEQRSMSIRSVEKFETGTLSKLCK